MFFPAPVMLDEPMSGS